MSRNRFLWSLVFAMAVLLAVQLELSLLLSQDLIHARVSNIRLRVQRNLEFLSSSLPLSTPAGYTYSNGEGRGGEVLEASHALALSSGPLFHHLRTNFQSSGRLILVMGKARPGGQS